MSIQFETIEYLKSGTARQVQAYAVLTKYQFLDRLSAYHPLLVGTIPINIDISTSDLDIICYWTNKDEFTASIKTLFADQLNFNLWENEKMNAVVAGFTIEDFDIEIFGQNIPTKEQLGYRHMIIEHEILKQRGEDFRQQIIELKKQGHKTEVAFGLLLGLTENPYEQLLTYLEKNR